MTPPPSSSRSFNYYGYRIVAATFAAQALAIGLSIYLYPVFMGAFESEYDLNRSQSSMGISLVMITGAIIGPWIGHRIDKGSPKKFMFVGGLMIGSGLIFISQSSNLIAVVTVWILGVGIGQSLLGPIPSMAILANWFVNKRGTMIAIAAIGTSFGGALVPLVSNALIAAGEWRHALLILGCACIIISAAVTLFGIIKNPKMVGHYPDGRPESNTSIATDKDNTSIKSILLESQFWMVALSFAIISSSMIILMTHMVPWAIEKGFEMQDAARLLAIAAIALIPGKMVFGYLNDRKGPKVATILAVLMMSIGWVLVRYSSAFWLFSTGATLFFFSVSATLPCEAEYVGRIWGTKRFGMIYGFVQLIVTCFIFIAPLSVGVVFDTTGSYKTPMMAVQVILFVPLLLLGLLPLEKDRKFKPLSQTKSTD